MMEFSQEDAKKLREDLRTMTRAQEAGDTLTAYDLAKQYLDSGSISLGLQYHMVLALARVGLTDRALEHYEAWELDQHMEGEHRSEIAGLAARVAEYRANVKMRRLGETQSHALLRTQWTADFYGRAYEDVAAMGARLHKDKSWNSIGADRRKHAQKSAVAYAKVYEDTHGYYVGVNCAAMHLLAGDPTTAAAMADQVLAKWMDNPPHEKEEKYLFSAMMFQAHLLAREYDAVQHAAVLLEDMHQYHPKNLIIASTMIRQIRRICEQLDVNSSSPEGKVTKYCDLVKDKLNLPTVIHYCGHMASVKGAVGRFPFDEQDRVADEIKTQLSDLNVGAGYGGLACGADIMFAEALLEREAELHVILPFEKEEFVETSVRRGGMEWISRFEHCWERATSKDIVTKGGFLGDVALFRYGADIAMGQAMLRAENLGLPRKQVAVWDTEDPDLIAGTSENVRRWKLHNSDPMVISSGAKTRDMPYSSRVRQGQGYGREIRACLFGDIKGFSNLEEERLPSFWDTVIELFAEVINAFDNSIDHFNTWGDGLYLVMKDAASAADCALTLQEEMYDRRSEFKTAGLPENLALRLGGHIGPVLQKKDAVHQRHNWCGTTVAKAARIEPITRPGEVFVTDAFTSLLALEAGPSQFICEYEGNRPSAKGYGNFRMYRLKRKRHTGAAGKLQKYKPE